MELQQADVFSAYLSAAAMRQVLTTKLLSVKSVYRGFCKSIAAYTMYTSKRSAELLHHRLILTKIAALIMAKLSP